MMSRGCGIYIHIPFCRRKCPYCDFYSVVCDDTIKDDYVAALINDIKEKGSKDIIVDTVYFGGGTPTVLPANKLIDILRAVKENYSLLTEAEITCEANPCTVDVDYLCELFHAGFNRISFGVQSCNDSELEALGRLHSFEQAENAIRNASNAGFYNISCDLMLGTIGQTEHSLMRSIDMLSSLPVTHISAYMLKIEEGTAYDCDNVRANVASDELSAELYLAAVERLRNNGFEQYEISNFCKNGMRSKHNMKYWRLGDYLGFGCSAHSYFNGKRFFYERDIAGYILAPDSILRIEDECPNTLEEYTMLSLRTCDGIDADRFTELGGNIDVFNGLATELSKHGLAVCENNILRLTPEGFLVSNSIIVKLLYN